jgi:hypothetical protein
MDWNRTLNSVSNNLKTSKNDGLLYLNDPLSYSIEHSESSNLTGKLDSQLAGRASGGAGKPQTLFSVKNMNFFPLFFTGSRLRRPRVDYSVLFRTFWGSTESLSEFETLWKTLQHIPAAFSRNG